MPQFTPVTDPFPSKHLPASPQTFYDRPNVVDEIIYSLLAGESVSVVGERKAGKSSLLDYLHVVLPQDKFLSEIINTQIIVPKNDKVFLGSLSQNAARRVANAIGLKEEIKMMTLTSRQEDVYQSFQVDLEKLRGYIQNKPTLAGKRFVWLIDEIEILRDYKDTYLFTFLRPLAQSDPIFRMVVAGYDVLYELSQESDWPVFFNAFHSVALDCLPDDSARKMVLDAMTTIGTNLKEDHYAMIFDWTGKKPYFIKWFCSVISYELNNRKTDLEITIDLLKKVQDTFLGIKDIRDHFNYLWNKHSDEGQRVLLSILASLDSAKSAEKLLEVMKEKQIELIVNDKQALQHIKDALSRLEQQGFVNGNNNIYVLSSGCLQTWIKIHKPL